MQARIGAGRGRGCQVAFMAAKVEGEVERVEEVGGKGRGRGSLLMNLAAKRAEVEEEDVKEGGVEEEYVEKEYVAEEEVERFQDLENVKVVSENDKGITRRNAISGSFGMSFDFPSLF